MNLLHLDPVLWHVGSLFAELCAEHSAASIGIHSDRGSVEAAACGTSSIRALPLHLAAASTALRAVALAIACDAILPSQSSLACCSRQNACVQDSIGTNILSGIAHACNKAMTIDAPT